MADTVFPIPRRADPGVRWPFSARRFGMEIDVRAEGAVTVVACSGSMGEDDPARFGEVFRGLLDAGRRYFVLDLSSLRYVNSTMLGELVSALRQARDRSGTVRLVSPRGRNVHDILRIAGLDRVFQVFDGVRQALTEVTSLSSTVPE